MIRPLRYNALQGDRKRRAREELTKIEGQVRDFLCDGELADWIKDVVDELLHNSPRKKATARTKQVRITSALVREVLDYVKQHPTQHDREIGLYFGIDGGRVSEIVQGHRTPTHPQGTPAWKGLPSW